MIMHVHSCLFGKYFCFCFENVTRSVCKTLLLSLAVFFLHALYLLWHFIHQSIDCSSLHSSNLPAHMLCNFSSGNVTEFVLPKAYIGCDVYNTLLYISLCDVLFYYYCISMRTFYSMKQSFYHLFVAACICTVPHILILCCMYNVYTCVCVC